jgi:hypothetical protein
MKLLRFFGGHIHEHIVVFKRRIGEGGGGEEEYVFPVIVPSDVLGKVKGFATIQSSAKNYLLGENSGLTR